MKKIASFQTVSNKSSIIINWNEKERERESKKCKYCLDSYPMMENRKAIELIFSAQFKIIIMLASWWWWCEEVIGVNGKHS